MRFLKVGIKRIAKALTSTETATEINAGLYYRYPVQEMCPGPRFYKPYLSMELLLLYPLMHISQMI